MTKLQAPTFRGIRYYAREDGDHRYFYWAERPRPATRADGSPVLDIYDAGSTATLATQVCWGPVANDLEALRSHLAGEAGVKAGRIRLSHAPFQVDTVRLVLRAHNGATTVLAQTDGSGYPPYDALFNVQLVGEEREGVMDALAGGGHHVVAQYEGVFQPEVDVAVDLEGDPSLIQNLGADAPRRSVRDRVEAALREGTLAIQMSGDAPDTLRAQVREMALDLFARRVQAHLKEERRSGGEGADAEGAESRGSSAHDSTAADSNVENSNVENSNVGDSKAEKSLEGESLEGKSVEEESSAGSDRLAIGVNIGERDHIPYRMETHLRDWFEAFPPEGRIHPVGGGKSEESASGESEIETESSEQAVLRSEIPLGEAPVEAIEVRQGDVERVFEASRSTPWRLPEAAAKKPITVRTAYDLGGENFESEVAAADSGGWTLEPSDLGLAHVVLDATKRRAAGAEEVRVRVQYRPREAGERDDRTLYLERGDWTREWYVITRSTTLAGTLECNVVETGRDGTRRETETSTEDPTIHL